MKTTVKLTSKELDAIIRFSESSGICTDRSVFFKTYDVKNNIISIHSDRPGCYDLELFPNAFEKIITKITPIFSMIKSMVECVYAFFVDIDEMAGKTEILVDGKKAEKDKDFTYERSVIDSDGYYRMLKDNEYFERDENGYLELKIKKEKTSEAEMIKNEDPHVRDDVAIQTIE